MFTIGEFILRINLQLVLMEFLMINTNKDIAANKRYRKNVQDELHNVLVGFHSNTKTIKKKKIVYRC